MKILTSIILLGALFSCASTQKKPTDKTQVQNLQKMCAKAESEIKARQEKKSFYERLGKEKKIQEFSSKLYDSHKNNEKIGHMFKHVEKGPFVSRVVEFLVAGTGGKAKYTGKSMKAVHRNMNITPSDFLAAGGDVQEVMKEMRYGENEIQEMVCALVSFVPVIVKM